MTDNKVDPPGEGWHILGFQREGDALEVWYPVTESALAAISTAMDRATTELMFDTWPLSARVLRVAADELDGVSFDERRHEYFLECTGPPLSASDRQK